MTGRSGASAPYRLAADTFGPAEINAAKSVLDSGMLTMGERVRTFEEQFAAWIDADHAVMVNSGSSANLLVTDALLRSTGTRPLLEPGDEVIVPGLAWPTTVWPLVQLGLVPVFVDVDSDTLAIDLESAAEAIGPKTRGMFLIHPLGRAVDLSAYGQFCADRDLVLIEDCCESLGAHSSGAHVGTRGRAGSFSFYYSHHISTIEGGMIATNDPALADDLRGLRAHGWIRDRSDRDTWLNKYSELDPRFLFATMGYNVRPTEIQAAIGSVQLDRLDDMLDARERLALQVRRWLANAAPWLQLIGDVALETSTVRARRKRTHSWMTLPMRILPGSHIDRDAVVRCLERDGVETRPIIAGNLARHPATASVKHRAAAAMPVCDGLLKDGFMIGCHPVIEPESLATLEHAITDLAHTSP
jgi:CDP-6-deoxy-D-xylo-4-hexulose-3-dehydrase